jgi:hypothetical protein
MEREMLNAEETAVAAGTDWISPGEDDDFDGPIVIRPSWHVMVAQLAGAKPEPIRVSDFGRGSRVISRALSGDHEELDLDDEDDDVPRAMH